MILTNRRMPEPVYQCTVCCCAGTPVVITVTANGRDEAINAAESRGVSLGPVLTKPVLLQAKAGALTRAMQLDGIAQEDTSVDRNESEPMTVGLKGLRLLRCRCLSS